MISRDFFKRNLFTNKKPLSFSCPTCYNGHFRVAAENITIRQTADEIKARNRVEISNINYEMFRFVTIPACDSCGEVVTISGTAVFYNELNYRANSGYSGAQYIVFTPMYFYPPVNPFIISAHCPENIKACILKAFSHYWNDLSSSANRIRTAVELIMDQQGIDKAGTLHNRIESYKKINFNLGNQLMALKWIGNVGSHETIITQDDLLNGFELLESIIEELYERPNRAKKLCDLSDNINKNKGL
ncbi:unnamed protein product [Rotaria sp. Silwood2]|nr:unnamed protein product [Rotaria sp. Silwood2]CAF4003465.1 unnamed protein product [Rotaria sp. Silwood2]